MARRRYKKQNNAGLRICCVVLALMLAAGLTLGGLELWGKGKMKPSNWFKSDLAPVTITLADAPAPALYGARAYALDEPDSYPSTKRATATCTLPEGGSPERYEWEITGGEGLSVQTVNADGSAADVTAQQYFPGAATLTARAYRGNELRGIGRVSLMCDPDYVPEDDREFNLAFIQLDTSYFINDYYTTDKEECLAELEGHFTNATTRLYTLDHTNSDQITQTYEDAIKDFGAEIVVIFDHFGKIMQGLENYENEHPDIQPIIIDYVEAYPDIAAKMNGIYLVGAITVTEDSLAGDLTEIEANLGDVLEVAIAQRENGKDYYPMDIMHFLNNRDWKVLTYIYTGDPMNDDSYVTDLLNSHPDDINAFFVPSSNELPALINALNASGRDTSQIWFMVFDMRDDTYAAQYNIIQFHYRLKTSDICKAIVAFLDGENPSDGEYYGYVYEKG